MIDESAMERIMTDVRDSYLPQLERTRTGESDGGTRPAFEYQCLLVLIARSNRLFGATERGHRGIGPEGLQAHVVIHGSRSC
jgi:hypothetical protein